MDIEGIKYWIKKLDDNQYSYEFYIALLLYEVFNIKDYEINEKLISKAYKIIEKYDSIYNQELHDEIHELLPNHKYY